MTITIQKSEKQERRSVKIAGHSLQTYLLKRGERIPEVKTSVYLLFDERKTCFYVGETDNKPTGGFDARFKSHEGTKKEHWFSRAVCFSDDRFVNSETRRWIEWRLFEIIKRCHYVVISNATKTFAELVPPPGGQELLDEVMEMLDIFGIFWAEATASTATQVATIVKTSETIGGKNLTQTAKLIASKFNDGKAVDYAIQLLNKKASVKKGRWHDILKQVGLSFDDKGFVVDWRKANIK